MSTTQSPEPPTWLLHAYKHKCDIEEIEGKLHAINKNFEAKINSTSDKFSAKLDTMARRITELDATVSGFETSISHLQQENKALKSEVRLLKGDFADHERISYERYEQLTEVDRITREKMTEASDQHVRREKQIYLELDKRDGQIAELKASYEEMQQVTRERGAAGREQKALGYEDLEQTDIRAEPHEIAMRPTRPSFDNLHEELEIPPPQASNIFSVNISLASQGKVSLEEYLDNAVHAISVAYSKDIERLEEAYAKAFVQNLRESQRKERLWQELGESGWDWGNVQAVMREMVKETKKRGKKRRRYLGN